MKRTPLAIQALVLALLSGGCGTYHAGYDYAPAPAIAVASDGARALATVIGVRRADDGRPALVEIRFRLTMADGPAPRLDTESLSLTAADLTELPLAEAMSEERQWTLLFEVPAGLGPDDLDLDGLTLAWQSIADGTSQRGTLSFRREWLPPPYPYHSYGYGGYWYGHRHHYWHDPWWWY